MKKGYKKQAREYPLRAVPLQAAEVAVFLEHAEGAWFIAVSFYSKKRSCSIRTSPLLSLLLLRQLYIANEMRRIKRQMQGGGGRRCRSIGD